MHRTHIEHASLVIHCTTGKNINAHALGPRHPLSTTIDNPRAPPLPARHRVSLPLHTSHRAYTARDTSPLRDRANGAWGGGDAHLDAALNPALLEGEGASELNETLLQVGGTGKRGGGGS